jgi:AAA+ ATPase superfamily predicted ATPase
MATIIGRQNEMSELRKYIDSDKAEFIAIYGRRRVRKTFLGVIEDMRSVDHIEIVDATADIGTIADKIFEHIEKIL